MAGYKCKKCKAKNTILKEWIELGVNRIVVCNECGHKMNLNLSASNNPIKKGTQIIENSQSHNHNTEGGTQIEGLKKPNSSNFHIQVVKGSPQTQSLSLDLQNETYTIYMGRNPESKKQDFKKQNDVVWVIDDAYVSRLHCLITVLNQNNKVQFILEDTDSANGTLVNNNTLEKEDRILLNIGDEISIGDTVLVLNKE